jgi:hypothetical protein
MAGPCEDVGTVLSTPYSGAPPPVEQSFLAQIFRPAAKRLLSRFAAGLSRCFTNPHQDSHDGGELEQIGICFQPPGRANGLVAKGYLLLFLDDFFAPFFFVDFLAFLAAM